MATMHRHVFIFLSFLPSFLPPSISSLFPSFFLTFLFFLFWVKVGEGSEEALTLYLSDKCLSYMKGGKQ